MKKILFAVLAVSLMSMTSDGTQKVKWQKYTTDLGMFSAAFPGDYTETANADVDDDYNTFKVRCDYHEMGFMVASTKHESSLEGETLELLKVSLKEFNAKLEGTVVTEEKITLKGSEGIYAEINLKDDVKIEYKVFMEGHFQYQVIAWGTGNSYDPKIVKKYFKSFKILK